MLEGDAMMGASSIVIDGSECLINYSVNPGFTVQLNDAKGTGSPGVECFLTQKVFR